MKVLVLDTETTGLPVKEPWLSLNQPWMIELGCILWDFQTKKELWSLNTLVIPHEKAVFHPKAMSVNGITVEEIMDTGRSTLDVCLELQDMVYDDSVDVIAAYNFPFDHRIVESSATRIDPTFGKKPVLGDPNKKLHFCIMEQAAKHLGRKRKLAVTYKDLFGKDLENSHKAMVDGRAAMECMYEMMVMDKNATN
jgi:DNA polymerase III epsilon subunit-like protein